MAVDLVIASDRYNSDPDARTLIEYLANQLDQALLQNATVYYDFPGYADYESVLHKADILVVTQNRGVFPLKIVSDYQLFNRRPDSIDEVEESLDNFSSILISRFLKSRILKKSITEIKFPVTPIMFSLSRNISLEAVSFHHAQSLNTLEAIFGSVPSATLSDEEFSELRSVLEGAKALTKPLKRLVPHPDRQTKALALSALEAEIANFDEKQRYSALSIVPGPQRIRGLAGSGKTVILAMKAAHLHLNNPDANILFTYYTRSLKASITNLITRFFRHYKDEDPNWGKLHIRHGWGGTSVPGVYYDACRRHGLSPHNFETARNASGGKEPFDFVCDELLKKKVLEQFYDYILIDEGQDFPSSFYKLCFFMAKGERDSKSIIWAYDDLQNILNVKMRASEKLFGKDADGQPRISLERAAGNLPPTASNDIVLSKCYRNQREVLLVSHALGFGIYSDTIVQMLESAEHWHDVGYKVISGDFKVGSQIKILRPPENSPLSLKRDLAGEVIDFFVSEKFSEELGWIASEIKGFIDQGLRPEDILVVALDDRNARRYFRYLSELLAAQSVNTNNVFMNSFSEAPFFIDGMVTLSTVYRAKGNEAAAVFAVGVDAIPGNTRSGRNKLFAAFTRSKAWLRISGIGASAKLYKLELSKALAAFPYLEFRMPDLEKVETIQRDLSNREGFLKRLREEFIERLQERGFSDREIDEALAQELKGSGRRKVGKKDE